MTDLLQAAQQLSGISMATLLIVVLLGGAKGWWYFGKAMEKKTEECEYYKSLSETNAKKADDNEKKYVNLLIADIEERKGRDKTLELITRAATSRDDQR